MRLSRLSPLLLLVFVAGCGTKNHITSPLANDVTLDHEVTADHSGGGGAGSRSGFVYTLSNSSSGNAVLAFHRNANGTLGAPESFSTGGTGTGAGLGNQGALVLDRDGSRLFAVNSGSNDISSLRLTPGGVKLVDKIASGGLLPISLTRHGRLLYVLNGGGEGNITGFRIGENGRLTRIPGSTQGLGGTAVGPAQIGFSRDGEQLIVTEKIANAIAVFNVSPSGRASAPHIQPSSGQTPFGFAFTREGVLIVSEAFGGAVNASAASSYWVTRHGTLAPVSRTVPTLQTAACWVAIPEDGRFAYTTNTGSNSVSGFSIGAAGTLARLDADGVTASADGGPIDATFNPNGRSLYVLNGRAHSLNVYLRSADGHLSPLTGVGELPAGGTGLVAN